MRIKIGRKCLHGRGCVACDGDRALSQIAIRIRKREDTACASRNGTAAVSVRFSEATREGDAADMQVCRANIVERQEWKEVSETYLRFRVRGNLCKECRVRGSACISRIGLRRISICSDNDRVRTGAPSRQSKTVGSAGTTCQVDISRWIEGYCRWELGGGVAAKGACLNRIS